MLENLKESNLVQSINSSIYKLHILATLSHIKEFDSLENLKAEKI